MNSHPTTRSPRHQTTSKNRFLTDRARYVYLKCSYFAQLGAFGGAQIRLLAQKTLGRPLKGPLMLQSRPADSSLSPLAGNQTRP
jgi:hypothetical protein